MEIKLIKTENEYQEAINYLETIGDDPNFENNPELIQNFELLSTLIKLYEEKKYPIEKGNPIDIIKLKMEYMGLERKDLIPWIGSKGLVSDVLNKKRKLSKSMIRNLSKSLNISQEILNVEYELFNNSIKSQDIKKQSNLFSNTFQLEPSQLEQVIIYQSIVTRRGALLNIASIY